MRIPNALANHVCDTSLAESRLCVKGSFRIEEGQQAFPDFSPSRKLSRLLRRSFVSLQSAFHTAMPSWTMLLVAYLVSHQSR
jgi:hypothetical protein